MARSEAVQRSTLLQKATTNRVTTVFRILSASNELKREDIHHGAVSIKNSDLGLTKAMSCNPNLANV